MGHVDCPLRHRRFRLEKTKIGIASSAAVVNILVGFAASNGRIIPYESPAYSTAWECLFHCCCLELTCVA
ncbi:hypothetical protein Patl1_20198 [Pistacia atlantica]|uniref:Uncharacterized protein n=1 Tax=Pistacia atlantica TaxID=434234 RepID=A0ACC1BJU5_9ROSI|nr:hypothetical protein Patl1_20198 [Pistacia atlantica]